MLHLQLYQISPTRIHMSHSDSGVGASSHPICFDWYTVHFARTTQTDTLYSVQESMELSNSDIMFSNCIATWELVRPFARPVLTDTLSILPEPLKRIHCIMTKGMKLSNLDILFCNYMATRVTVWCILHQGISQNILSRESVHLINLPTPSHPPSSVDADLDKWVSNHMFARTDQNGTVYTCPTI